jgi:hypothetical protein
LVTECATGRTNSTQNQFASESIVAIPIAANSPKELCIGTPEGKTEKEKASKFIILDSDYEESEQTEEKKAKAKATTTPADICEDGKKHAAISPKDPKKTKVDKTKHWFPFLHQYPEPLDTLNIEWYLIASVVVHATLMSISSPSFSVSPLRMFLAATQLPFPLSSVTLPDLWVFRTVIRLLCEIDAVILM